jgi:acetolactate synthase-1/2/3 large subunit
MSTEDLKIWFGILALIVVELGLITPPVGMNVFVISALAKDTPMSETFKGVMPFFSRNCYPGGPAAGLPGNHALAAKASERIPAKQDRGSNEHTVSGDITAGGAIFTRLKALGVDYVFTNSGTDFPPIIEGLAEAAAKNIDLPKPLVIPHEHAAMGMAHGYYLMTGKAQAVMLHTNVGLSNGATGAINAACENIPMLIMSGRTPVTETGRFGARTVPIAWGQEMRDQTALVRESCKWDYELRFPEQIGGLLDRAHAIANSTPKGPIYLSLPRETLCEPTPRDGLEAPPTIQPVIGAPNPDAIRQAASWLAGARSPLVIAQRGIGDENTFDAFAKWAEDWGIAVCSWWATHLAISTDHPCHVGADPGAWMREADVVVVLNSLSPWWPDKHKLAVDAKVINIGPDPVFSRFPVRNFRSDLTIAGETAFTIPALIEAMDKLVRDEKVLEARRERLSRASAEIRDLLASQAKADTARGITKSYVSHCLGEALDGLKASVFSELGTSLGTLKRDPAQVLVPGTAFRRPRLEFPDGPRRPACRAGPHLCRHNGRRLIHVRQSDGLPPDRRSARPAGSGDRAEQRGMGRSAGIGQRHVSGRLCLARQRDAADGALKPSPDFTYTAAASRAWARRVSDPAELPKVIEQALKRRARRPPQRSSRHTRIARLNGRVFLCRFKRFPDIPQKTGGKGRPPRSSVIQRVSVNVSIDHLPPCLPRPDALKPPNGTCGSSFTGEQLTWQLPVSSLLTISSALPSSSDITPAVRPYSLSLAIRTASSSLPTLKIEQTGPNVSSW